MYTVKKCRDEVYAWALIDPDESPIAKFVFEADAELAADFFNKEKEARDD